jgi:RNA 2',3'-cyclic 3'-phosphodiesterase
MRLFIGIPLAPAVAEQLGGLRARFESPGDGLRWSSPESWHITLQFLGATSESQYACVVQRLGCLNAPAVPIKLEGIGFFDRAGVFFAGILATPSLAGLQARVTAATSHCGFEPEDRPYHPHITLARRKGQSNGIRNLKARIESLHVTAPRFSPFTAREFLLYESIPSPSGSRYQVRNRFPLHAE